MVLNSPVLVTTSLSILGKKWVISDVNNVPSAGIFEVWAPVEVKSEPASSILGLKSTQSLNWWKPLMPRNEGMSL